MYYRRLQTPGASFFFTLVTYQRNPLFADIRNIKLLREVIKKVQIAHPFKIDAFALLPDHLHCIWTLPTGDADFSMRWRLIKSYFTRNCLSEYKNISTLGRKYKKEQCIWQRRFWEHQIRNEEDFKMHVEYIHYNPVKHGYAKAACDWNSSSFHRYVKAGIYNNDWGVDEKE